MAAFEDWRTVWRRFDPEEPAPAAWRVDRPYSPVTSILAELQRGYGDTRFLLLGTPGSGKTTELRRLAEALRTTHAVVMLDLHQYFLDRDASLEGLESLQAWEALFLIGLAIVRVAEELEVPCPEAEQQALGKAVETFLPADDATLPTLDIGALSKGVAVAVAAGATTAAGGPIAGTAGAAVATGALKMLEIAASAVKWPIQLGMGRRVDDRDERATRLLDAVNALVYHVHENYPLPVALLLDGMDRITQPTTARALFIESGLLGRLACPTVITGPVQVRRKGLEVLVKHLQPEVLTEIPVLHHLRPDQDGKGIEFLVEVYERRVQDLSAAQVVPEALRRLARYSGGRMRDFMHLIREVAKHAGDQKTSEVTVNLANEAIDDLRRRRERGISREEVFLLEDIMKDERHLLPDDEAAHRLLERFCLLPYPDGSEWYYPHPLLTLKLLRG